MFLQASRLWAHIPRPIKRWIGPALLVGVATIALSFVPVVSAHVPGMKTLSTTVRKVLGMKPAPSPKKAAAPKASGQKRTQKTAPKVAQKSAPAKAVATLPFTVKSTPSGATVQIDGRPVGKTPVTLKLASGTHKLTISRSGFAPVTRTVTVKKGGTASLAVKLTAAAPISKSKAASAPTAKASPPPSAAKLLDVGARAPAIALKDGRGRGHSLSALRGQQVVVLFIWSLDSKAKALIEELDGYVRNTGEERPVLVVVASGDAAAAQKYAATAGLRVPLLLGGGETARSYGVPTGATVLYVVSESGMIAQRQVNNILLTPLFPRPRG